MKKGILIIGNNASGKSYLSKLLIQETPKENVFRTKGEFIKHHLKNDLKHRGCHENTSVFFVDDVCSMSVLNMYANEIKNQSMTVKRLNQSIIEINPRIIMNCTEKLTDKILKDFDSKYADYFQLINTSNPLKIIDAIALMDKVTNSLEL